MSLIKAPKLQLKPLPRHLKYLLLGDDDTLLIIISVDFSTTQEEQVRSMVQKYKLAIGWTLADIKGMSPTICLHHIHLEEANPVHDQQRKLNLAMKEVVLKEVLKLLNQNIIYLIFYSKWISPVHVVPKKSGIEVIKNEKKEMVGTPTANMMEGLH